jgi:mercuric ion transport protein
MALHPRIELFYDPECPNVVLARSAIREALSILGAPEVWQEWDRGSIQTPGDRRQLGSPSVLVDGRDVGCDGGSLANADANSCRVYVDGCGCICGAPSADLILAAIASADGADGADGAERIA